MDDNWSKGGVGAIALVNLLATTSAPELIAAAVVAQSRSQP